MFNSKLKLILLAVAGCMIAILAISKLNQWIVQPAFDELERAQALEDNGRAEGMIQGELRQLGEHLNDWAKWDDAYAYANDPDSAFISANFSNWPMLEKGFRLNFCLILDRNGRILYRGGYDSNLGGAVSPAVFAGDPPAILTVFQPALTREQPVDGLLRTEYGVLLLAARPILTTQGTGPASGVVIFGRFLDPPLLHTLIAQTQMKFAVLSENGSPLSAEEQTLWRTLTPGVPVVWRDVAGQQSVYMALADLADQPVVLLRTPVRAEITAIGQRTKKILDAATSLMLVTLTVLMLYLLMLVAQRRRAETVAATRLAELHERDRLFRQLFERSGDANLLLDRDGFFDCNDAALALLGAAATVQILGCQPWLLSPERQPDGRLSAEKAREHIEAAFTDGHRRFEWVHRRLDGREVWVDVVLTAIPWQGRQILHTAWRDMTGHKRAEERQRLASTVFEGTQEAVVVLDAQLNIVAVNPAFTALSGYTETEVLDKEPSFLRGNRPDAYYQAIGQAVTEKGYWQGKFWGRRKNGGFCPTFSTLTEVRDAVGQITHYVGIATDISSQKEADIRIKHLVYYDALTQLPNRMLLAQRADQALAQAARRGEEAALLFLDLDRFKELNNTLGHAEGDALLVSVAAQIKEMTRETDILARVGSDEFVLLLPDTGQIGAARLAEKFLIAFRKPFVIAGHSLRITVSIGIALYPHNGTTFNDLLKNSNAALHQAKQDGRDTLRFYDGEMNRTTLERLVLDTELRAAIQSGQLRAYFQPKVYLVDGRPAGAEALVRWLHPEQGLILPGHFIPIAEASDLILAIGDWMLEEVCRQQAAWREAGRVPFTVAVNLAARHFRDPHLVERIQQLLTTYRLKPDALELELTETTLIETGPQTIAMLVTLHQMGVGLAIDDFGTGYSSLDYLKRLPITVLKIDQRFVRDLATEADDRTLAATIVTLGHGLGLSVVAEGVEIEEQRYILLEQGCELAQGYLFSPPLPAEEFAAWWDQQVKVTQPNPKGSRQAVMTPTG
ncbi:MAG: EAL domain-containing protein [Candidatus Contendobacter sp.]|nr:EAL domain-containing protein [Candidatus Contendobacter sp.]